MRPKDYTVADDGNVSYTLNEKSNAIATTPKRAEEAALAYSNNYAMSEERRRYCIEDFVAGAAWLAREGVVEVGTMGEFGIALDKSVVARLADMFKEGDRVVVQYRKPF